MTVRSAASSRMTIDLDDLARIEAIVGSSSTSQWMVDQAEPDDALTEPFDRCRGSAL